MTIKSKDFWGDILYNKSSMQGVNYPAGSVGIEVELEGTLFTDNFGYWKIIPEQSLRQNPHGYEYVMINPFKGKDLKECIDDFSKQASKMTIKPSIRCSTHMHVSVQGRKNKEILSAVALYMLVEEVLVSLQPRSRIGNLFCRRVSDAEAIPISLVSMVQNSASASFYGWNNYHKDAWKYGAINLATINSYGSLEFRFMEAMWDKERLTQWSLGLQNLVMYGLENSIETWLSEYNSLPVRAFLEKVFKEQATGFIAGRTSFELNRLMHTNYSFINDILYAFKTKKYRVSNHTLAQLSDLGAEGIEYVASPIFEPESPTEF